MQALSISKSRRPGFTFIELVIVIAIIGIMSLIAISNFTNVNADAREIVARQQQAALQGAVNAWVTAQLSTSTTVSEVRATYNALATSKLRLDLVSGYLDEPTYEHFIEQGSLAPSDEVTSDAVRKLGWHISMPDWDAASYPKVDLVHSAP